MNEEIELFYEDCNEQLTNLENALLQITQNGVNPELIGEIFRSFHTIKGNAAMMEFNHVVDFTHKAESLLDEIRQGKKVITHDLVMLFFECKDHIELLVEAILNNNSLSEETIRNNDKLIELLNNELGSGFKKQDDELINIIFEDDNFEDNNKNIWDISICFKEDFLTSGMDIFSVLKFLSKQGEAKVEADISEVPILQECNPLRVYLKLNIKYSTQLEYDEILEIFEFIIDDISLEIKKDETELIKEIEKQKTVDNEKEEVRKVENINQIVQNNNSTKEKTATFRVDSSKIDSIINTMSQMVIEHGKILDTAMRKYENDIDFMEEMEGFSSLMEELRKSIMGVRLMPVGDSFGKFKRIVVDTAKKLDKDVEFIIKGEETEIDKTIIEKISDPLIHMLRNSIDHGLETKEERKILGKNAKGVITLDISVDGGTILIIISDDGKGINKTKVFEKALANNIVKTTDKLSDKEIFNLIFSAGLSTADKLSDISGRGVGMDVVKSNIEELRGSIEVDSKEGFGSKFTIRLPSSLAIIDGLLVSVGLQKYVIPLESIVECIEFDEKFISSCKTDDYVQIKNELLPILYCKEYFADEYKIKAPRENLVLVQIGKSKMAILVDELIGEIQCVLKPLGALFNGVIGINSATILGNGDIAFVFDISKLLEKMRS